MYLLIMIVATIVSVIAIKEADSFYFSWYLLHSCQVTKNETTTTTMTIQIYTSLFTGK